MCVLLGGLAWGQAQPGAPPPAQPGRARMGGPQAAAALPDTAESVPATAAVLTITGVCKPQPRPAAAKPGAAAAKPAAKAAPEDCKTVVTRAEFEKLVDSISPHPNPQLRRQLATQYPGILAFAQAAQKQGIDKTARFQTEMKLVRLQILGKELREQISENAAKVSDEDVDSFYQGHLTTYQEFNLDRVFVPHFRPAAAEAKPELKDESEGKDTKNDKDTKSTPEQQQKAKADTEQEEAKLAESLRTQAAAGEDFVKLEKQAYDAAGMKMDAPPINLPKVRRNGLPPGQAAVFDLKEGEVSQVISDPGGHYIYKVKAIVQMPLDDQLKNEIHGMLQGQRQREEMDKYQKSYTVKTNEDYFGPPPPPGPTQRMLPNRVPQTSIPMTHPQAQPQTPTPAQPPAASPN
jgi:lipopolysaccharide export system protein LptC